MAHVGIEYGILTDRHHKDVAELLETSFYPFEPICKACGIPQNPKAMAELNSLAIDAARRFSASLVAIDTATDNVVGMTVLTIETKPATKDSSYFQKYGLEHFTQKESIAYINVESPKYHMIYDIYNVTTIMEGLFLVVSHKYRKYNIGMELMRQGVKLFHTLSEFPDGPQLLLCELTSQVSQKMGLSLNFEFIDSNDYDTLKHKFAKFADKDKFEKLCTKLSILKKKIDGISSNLTCDK